MHLTVDLIKMMEKEGYQFDEKLKKRFLDRYPTILIILNSDTEKIINIECKECDNKGKFIK